MDAELATLVDEVIGYGLNLKKRQDNGEDVSFADAQAELKRRLKSEAESWLNEDYGGDRLSMSHSSPGGAARRLESFFGARYALVCWLDETFILDSPWGPQWKELSLEADLYGLRDRAWLFWEQAKRAEGRASSDALEVFYLCVMLGFRGDKRDKLDALRTWRELVKGRITRQLNQEYPLPPEREPPCNAPPRRGREKFKRMLVTAGVAALALIPAATFLLISQSVGKR